jgi:hypothetical protein
MRKMSIMRLALVVGLGAAGLAQAARAQSPTGEATFTRVTLPADFASTFQLYDKVDKADRKIVRYLYINKEALAKVKPGEPFPDGTTLVMADHLAALDTAGRPLKQASGRLAATGRLRGVEVMTKTAGWGQTNLFPPDKDNGDWEYASFTTDGRARPIKLDACYACHLAQKTLDYTFSGQKIYDAARK